MTTYALIHGAWHGAWCWERLIPELELRGHEAVAVDLPCEDRHAGTAEYAETVMRALDGVDEEVVVVGHSLGGLTASLVAASRPSRHLILLNAAIPKLGFSVIEALEKEPYNEEGFAAEETGDGFMRPPRSAAADLLYNACEPADAKWAASKLRLQSLAPYTEPCTIDRYPAVPTTVVLGSLDRGLDVARMTAIARGRLDVEPIVIRSDHSPFLSMADELADLLVSVSEK